MAYLFPEYDPQLRMMKFIGASNPARWPKAASGEICIFEAVVTAGKALFGAEWSGEEFAAVVWTTSPKIEAAIKNRPKASSKYKPVSLGLSRSLPSSDASEAIWLDANAHVVAWQLELRERNWKRNCDRVQRLTAAVECIAQWCRDDHLQSFARLRVGGPLWPMVSSEWNLDDPLTTFVSEGGNKRYFYNFANKGPYDCYIFFQRAQLLALSGTLPNSSGEVDNIDISKLSPYLQLAVKVAIANEYFAESDCDTEPVRQAEVEQAWRTFMPDIPTSQTAISAIAKVMAYPNAKAIQQGKAGTKKKTGVSPKH